MRKLVRPIKGDRKSQGRESKDRKSEAGSLKTSEGLQNKTGSAPVIYGRLCKHFTIVQSIFNACMALKVFGQM